MSSRVVVIGLDGARYDVLEEWVERGELPTFSKLLSEGGGTTLRSILPGPHSGPAWTSFSTGCSPGKHGLPSARLLSGRTRRPATANDVRVDRYWEILSEYGRIAGVFNVPLTWPPDDIRGVHVSSWATPPFSDYATPPEFQSKLEGMGYVITTPFKSPNQPVGDLLSIVRKRTEAVTAFMEAYEWDHLMVTYYATELAHHQFAPFVDPDHPRYDPRYEGRALDVYRGIDSAIADILEQADDANVFVMSDHGFTPVYERIYVNKILEKHGFLVPDKSDYTPTESRDQLLSKAVNSANDFANAIGVKDRIRSLLRRPQLRGIGRKLADIQGGSHALASENTFDIKWVETTAFAGYETGCIFVNQTGVFEDGIVGPDEYDEVVDRIVEALRTDEYLAGRLVDVHRGDELFTGDGIQENPVLPDIVVQTKDEYRMSTGIPEEETFYRSQEEITPIGHHTMEGLFLAAGPDIVSVPDANPSLVDLAPTILHALDCPIPEHIDGEVLWDLFDPDSEIQNREINHIVSSISNRDNGELSAEDYKAIEDRLQNLGYKS